MENASLTCDELELIKSVVESLKTYAQLLAVTAAAFALVLSASHKSTNVTLTAENPLMIVDAKRFVSDIMNNAASGSISSSSVSRLTKALTVGRNPTELTSIGDFYVFSREWYHRANPVEYPSPKTISEEQRRGFWDSAVLAQRKSSLGYRDHESVTPVGIKFSKNGENMNSIDSFRGDPSIMWSDIEARESIFSQGSGAIYYADPFYETVEKFSFGEKRVVYNALMQSTTSYSCFTLENKSKEDVYDVRVVANVGTNELLPQVLNSYGIIVEHAVGDAVIMRVLDLPPGPEHYKFIAIRGSPAPVSDYTVRMDSKPFLEQLSDHVFAILFVPFIFALAEFLAGFHLRKLAKGI